MERPTTGEFPALQTGRLISNRVPGSSREITEHLSATSPALTHTQISRSRQHSVHVKLPSSVQRVRGAAMRRLLLLILLLSVTTDGKEEQPADKSPPQKVLQLNRGNFDRALREHKQLLVHFCKSRRETHSLVSTDLTKRNRWRIFIFSHGADSAVTLADHRVSEAFSGAVPELQGSEVTAAAVDVSQEKELAKELGASGHASIRLYLNGDRNSPEVCPGTCRDGDKLVNRLVDQSIWNIRFGSGTELCTLCRRWRVGWRWLDWHKLQYIADAWCDPKLFSTSVLLLVVVFCDIKLWDLSKG